MPMLMQGLAILRPTPEAPFGPEAEGTNPLCAPFRMQMPRTVAVVGNGPLTEPQRREIEACDVVVRYTFLRCLRLRKRSWDNTLLDVHTECSEPSLSIVFNI
jgi:hypothetical protein